MYRLLQHEWECNAFTIIDIIGTIVSSRKQGWKAELMTVCKHIITKLPYVNLERTLSNDTGAWRLDLPCVLHPKPEAALWRRAAVTQASLWSSGKWSDWSNTGTWTPTGGVLLQPYISGRAPAQTEAIIYNGFRSKNIINKDLGIRDLMENWRLFETHTYICKKSVIFPTFFLNRTAPTSQITRPNTPNLDLQSEDGDQKKTRTTKWHRGLLLDQYLRQANLGSLSTHTGPTRLLIKGPSPQGARLMLYRQFLWLKKKKKPKLKIN